MASFLLGTGSFSFEHVDPLLALRTIACADRWQAAWPQMAQHLRTHRRQQRYARRAAATVLAAPAPSAPRPEPILLRPEDLERTRPKTMVNGRPTADHPWKTYRRLNDSRPAKT